MNEWQNPSLSDGSSPCLSTTDVRALPSQAQQGRELSVVRVDRGPACHVSRGWELRPQDRPTWV